MKKILINMLGLIGLLNILYAIYGQITGAKTTDFGGEMIIGLALLSVCFFLRKRYADE